MIELTEQLLPHAEAMDDAFVRGVSHCHQRTLLPMAKDNWRYCRGRHGLAGAPRILTYGDDNLKLGKSEMFTVGYTGKQHVQRIGRLIVNACPHAGDCVKVCVLDNGHAQMDPRVKRSRRARNELLAKHPTDWAYLVGRELGRVAVKYPDGFLFRPNVATDVCWELLLPSMTSGSAIPWMRSYGYSKWPYVLDGDGWLDSCLSGGLLVERGQRRRRGGAVPRSRRQRRHGHQPAQGRGCADVRQGACGLLGHRRRRPDRRVDHQRNRCDR